MVKKYVYPFANGKADGSGDMKDLLGGKGAGLAEMTNAGLPVPPGFTITTEACNAYYAAGETFPGGMWEQALEALAEVERASGKRLGDVSNPLLVSVRSGAKFSMPGMMDTVLNLGLNEETLRGLASLTSNERFAYDAYRRFIQMFGKIVLGVDGELFEHALSEAKRKAKAKLDTDLNAEHLKKICEDFKKIVRQETGKEFPSDPQQQLEESVKAVFRSWNGDRAKAYRRREKIPDDLGTAVNVVTMVFGNMGDDSGTGVAFTRNPATGAKELFGDYLTNAQGEDVVAGIRTPKHISELQKEMPEVYNEFVEVAQRLERHYRDMQDLEFTIERGRLWMLQTRNGKRTGPAAVRIAVEMTREGLIDERTALIRVPAGDLDQLLHKMVDPKAKVKVLTRGINASPGAAVGQVVFTPQEAEKWAADGKPVILVRRETSPEDVRGMDAAQAILTSTGGPTSHAAVVARGWGKPCIVGASEVSINSAKNEFSVNGTRIRRGDWVTVDGTSGQVIEGVAPLIDPELGDDFRQLMEWTDKHRTLRVRANADTPDDAAIARGFGAEGIGLCRTEHMFFEGDRIDHVREVILGSLEFKSVEREMKAVDSELSRTTSPKKRGELTALRRKLKKEIEEPRRLYKGGLAQLLKLQRRDFEGIFRAMDGLPVTIRTLDPPLHEFLPHDEEGTRKLARKLKTNARHLWERVQMLHEANPMLGHRGCRLGIVFPEITEMQARAIFEAAARVQKKGVKVLPEIMIPLVSDVSELKLQADVVRRVAGEVAAETGATIDYLVGTMIELPRAALTADKIAEVAEFFSFGTNDLTQTTFGISRDDSAKFLPFYIEHRILKDDPFQVLDQEGVGELVWMGTQRGRATRADLKVGICGEHGGEPSSVAFCHRVGLSYVSCSPYRVPIARLAAAQAALGSAQAISHTA
ncbi:MAG TPA: pyruvate, phosphate dikinase [Blastocatellia bacterium]|jgi:pyruvate,orthophosphate dikinase|nr:pyruvate, phosphate dikinase [Blastocatellia bacterium]